MVDDETRERVLDAVGEKYPYADLSPSSPDREQVEMVMVVVETMLGDD